MAYEPFEDLHDVREALDGVDRAVARTIGSIALLALPQPYDFLASTERFRSYGADRANVWHDGGLHRVIAGPRGAARGRARRRRGRAGRRRHRCARRRGCSARRSTSTRFWAWARAEPALAALAEPLRGYRPPLVPDPWEMLVGLITSQQVSLHSAFAVRSRLIERFGVRHGEAWAFPTRERIAAAAESEIREVGFSTRKAEYVTGIARGDLDIAGARRSARRRA